jgi:hypothetical protein
VLRLIQSNRLDSERRENSLDGLKHEPKSCMKKSNEPAALTNVLELEFPDWSDMDGSSAWITADIEIRKKRSAPPRVGASLS